MKTAVLFLSLFVASATIGLAIPVIAVLGPPSPVTVGDPFGVVVDILGVTDLYAWQFDLDYTGMSFVAMEEGPFLRNVGPTFFAPGTDNGAGSIQFNADTLLGVGPGASGSGVLLLALFQATTPGANTISLSNVLLLDSNFNQIDAGTIPAVVEVLPEPATWWLGLLCILFHLILRRWPRSAGA